MSRIAALLDPARGGFELGLFEDAWMELDKFQSKEMAHPETLLLRLDILIGLKRWEDAIAMVWAVAEIGADTTNSSLKRLQRSLVMAMAQCAYGLLKNPPFMAFLLPRNSDCFLIGVIILLMSPNVR